MNTKFWCEGLRIPRRSMEDYAKTVLTKTGSEDGGLDSSGSG